LKNHAGVLANRKLCELHTTC